MSMLSIRSLPKEIEKALVMASKKTGASKSKIVKNALAQYFHLTEKNKRSKKLKKFFSTSSLTDVESKKLNAAMEIFNQVDKEFWK